MSIIKNVVTALSLFDTLGDFLLALVSRVCVNLWRDSD